MSTNPVESSQSHTSASGASDNQSHERLLRAEEIVHRNWKWAAGAGLVPIPFFDIIGATTIQLKMLKELCDVYGVKFTRNLGKSAIGSLLGGFFSNVGTSSLISLAKGIPVLGLTVGVLAQPAIFGATTYALGKVFIQHFETGGTLFTFNAQAMKEYFRQQFEAGKLSVEQNNMN